MSALGGHWALSEATKHKMHKPKSDEHKKHISESRKGSGNPMYGKHHSEEHRARLREASTGRHLTDEQKAKISGANNYRARKVAQYDANTGMLIARWDSACQAAKETGITQQNISKCCSHKRNTAGGFRWEYYIEEVV